MQMRSPGLLRPIAAVVLISGLTGPAAQPALAQMLGGGPSDVTCDIKVGGDGGSLTFRGEIRSGHATRGEFHLTAFRMTQAGSFRMNQANTFEVAPAAPAELGFISLTGSGGTYTAELLIRYDNGVGSCVKQVHGKAP